MLYLDVIVIIILIRSIKLGESPGVPSARSRAPGVVCPGQRHYAQCTMHYKLCPGQRGQRETHLRFKDLKRIIITIVIVINNINIFQLPRRRSCMTGGLWMAGLFLQKQSPRTKSSFRCPSHRSLSCCFHTRAFIFFENKNIIIIKEVKTSQELRMLSRSLSVN